MKAIRPPYAFCPVDSGRPWSEERVTIVPLIHLDHVPVLPEGGVPPSSVGMRGPYPTIMDVHSTSQHEYGLRVGIFRLLDLFDKLDIPATVALDSFSARHRPLILDRLLDSKVEMAAHAPHGASILHDGMSKDEQNDYIDGSISAVQQASGERPAGWSGLDYAQSTSTLDLLAEKGIRWTTDWPCDDGPHIISTNCGDIVNVPVSIHLDDVFAHLKRGAPIEVWERNIIRTVDVLQEEGRSGRTVVLGLHPWLIAQPFRFWHVQRMMTALRSRRGVAWGTAGMVAEGVLSAREGTS